MLILGVKHAMMLQRCVTMAVEDDAPVAYTVSPS
jgi:hypothetical protein